MSRPISHPSCHPADPTATPTPHPSTCLLVKRLWAPPKPHNVQPLKKQLLHLTCSLARKSTVPTLLSSSSSSSALRRPMFGRPTKAKIVATCSLSALPLLCPKRLVGDHPSPSETPTCARLRALKLCASVTKSCCRVDDRFSGHSHRSTLQSRENYPAYQEAMYNEQQQCVVLEFCRAEQHIVK